MQIIQHEVHSIQLVQYKWYVWIVRFFVLMFFISCAVEIVRLSADDYSSYLYSYHNPPLECLPKSNEKNETEWSWSMLAIPFQWTYKALFVPPASYNCAEYARRMNPIYHYLPRFPQAFANVLTYIIVTPITLFLDKFGDALRLFLDKFNVAERFFGVCLLMATMVLGTIVLLFVIWSSRMNPVQPVQTIATHTQPLRITRLSKRNLLQ